jgi:hypothetical protein
MDNTHSTTRTQGNRNPRRGGAEQLDFEPEQLITYSLVVLMVQSIADNFSVRQ